SVVACGGTWMVPSDLMDSGNWDEIARLVREL
ncbi:keto-hydroxyglutarate-aldolase/keto-deoxy-phosphogluconate aldolase, partial [Vibrio fluvialis]|nr:keto-hydroxyglutarate-aldolase/keto-deoxy-phosphogluconate aldolase [Vibrio fluvialis]